jgi:hypothetical protein
VLENQVGLTKKHLDQYKAMLAGNEDALTELNKVSQEIYVLCYFTSNSFQNI